MSNGGLSANASYVWGKLIDIGRNGNNNCGTATSVEDAFDPFINAFNIVVFGAPGAAVNDPANFGIVRTPCNQPRLIQLALRYTF
jgi:hypothetical protein